MRASRLAKHHLPHLKPQGRRARTLPVRNKRVWLASPLKNGRKVGSSACESAACTCGGSTRFVVPLPESLDGPRVITTKIAEPWRGTRYLPVDDGRPRGVELGAREVQAGAVVRHRGQVDLVPLVAQHVGVLHRARVQARARRRVAKDLSAAEGVG